MVSLRVGTPCGPYNYRFGTPGSGRSLAEQTPRGAGQRKLILASLGLSWECLPNPLRLPVTSQVSWLPDHRLRVSGASLWPWDTAVGMSHLCSLGLGLLLGRMAHCSRVMRRDFFFKVLGFKNSRTFWLVLHHQSVFVLI